MLAACRGALAALLPLAALLSPGLTPYCATGELAAAEESGGTPAPRRSAALLEGTSDADARRDAERSIPMRELSAADRRKVAALLDDATIYRRLPVQITRCDPRLHHYLISNPDVTVNIWRALGISELKVSRTGERTYRAVAPDGSVTELEYLHSDDETQVVHCEGAYNGPIFKSAMTGGALLVMKAGYLRETDGHYYATSRLDLFLRIDGAALGLLSRTVEPMIVSAAERNFADCSNFLSQLTTACAQRPETIQRMAMGLDLVDGDQRDRFAEIAGRIADDSATWVAARPRRGDDPLRDDEDPQAIGRTFRLPAATKLFR